MAGNEQHPANDVEGHGPMHQLGPEAVEEAQDADDAQGHAAKWGVDMEATDDVAGHGARSTGLDTEGTDEDQAGDDTEGHAGRYVG